MSESEGGPPGAEREVGPVQSLALLLPPSLRAALRFLTLLPFPHHPSEERSRGAEALFWFPLVGLALGLPVAGILLLPLPPLAGAALALALWTVLTGGLHEDGFLDCADAALAPVPLERRREILKDPHVGAHAATAGGLLLLLRFAALASVSPLAALVAPVIGRWSMTLTLASWPAAHPGLADELGQGAKAAPPTVMALGLLAALALLGAAPRVGLATALGLGVGFTAATFLVRRLGGATGDVHGAAGLLAETAALWAFVS